MSGTWIGMDTGGTFTDVVADDGRWWKLPSSAEDPASVMGEGVRLSGILKPVVRHGTTVATNAVLEGRCAPVGLLVNRGFRDLLTIGRQARPDLYDPEPFRPELPSEGRVAEIPGRLSADGSELEPFDPAACARAGAQLVRRGAQALAVVLLHSYRNPRHEQAAREALESLGVPVVVSSDVNPEFREVERGTCTVLDAGLRPPVSAYLARLEGVLARWTDRPLVMTSEGGLVTVGTAARAPTSLLVSGPAGGLVAARVFGEAAGFPTLLTLDMGGTSTDTAWIDGELPFAPELHMAGHRLRLPSLEIHTVGAGGGSLLELDAGGALCVGPKSAGSNPGPVAFGTGTVPALTDVHLALGRIDPRHFASWEDRLDVDGAAVALRRLARDAGMTAEGLSRGALAVADAVMARALRVISVHQGRDPRRAALLVFGGAGGLHGVTLARSLGIRHVLWPPRAGVLSAQGLLWAPPAVTASQSVLDPGLPETAARRKVWSPLVDRMRADLAAQGVARRTHRVAVKLDLRYRGQSFEVTVPEAADPRSSFHRLHAERFGFSDPEHPVEWIGVRVRVEGPARSPQLPQVEKSRRAPTPARHLKGPLSRDPVPVFARDDLKVGPSISGPAVIADGTGTFYLDRKSRASLHPTGTLVAEVDP